MSWFQSVSQPVQELVRRIQAADEIKVATGIWWDGYTTILSGVVVESSRTSAMTNTLYDASATYGEQRVACNSKEAKVLYKALRTRYLESCRTRNDAARAAISTHLGVSQ